MSRRFGVKRFIHNDTDYMMYDTHKGIEPFPTELLETVARSLLKKSLNRLAASLSNAINRNNRHD